MNSVSSSPWPGPALGVLLIALIALRWLLLRGRQRTGKRRVEICPGYRSRLRQLGLTHPHHFLSLPSVTVSGHPDRNVSRLVLGQGAEAIPVFLKREHRVPWLVRLRNWLIGFGWVSRSLRECKILQALQREGLPCPDWIAAGEDDMGRAFLLLRGSAGARDLCQALRQERTIQGRRRLARFLGETLARLHHKGFTHPDLYANHVLVRADGANLVVLDWQRTRPKYRAGWAQRGRDLAGLHITLPLELASERERWFCLRAYLAETARLTAFTGQKGAPRRYLCGPQCAALLHGLRQEARRRLRHRHVLEKRHQGLTRAHQDWLRLDGEALCVTSALPRSWPGVDPRTLALDRQPAMPRRGMTRRWLPMQDSSAVLLTRRKARAPFSSLWSWLRGRRWSSWEQRQSVLLLRLDRHGITAERVLAMGQRQQSGGRHESFLLTEPPARTLRLDLWLKRQRLQRTIQAWGERRQVLREAGATLARLHQACCYLVPSADASVFAVQVDNQHGRIALARSDWVCARRVGNMRQARRDLARLRHMLASAGCDRSELEQWDLGYRRQLVGFQQPRANRKEERACQT